MFRFVAVCTAQARLGLNETPSSPSLYSAGIPSEDPQAQVPAFKKHIYRFRYSLNGAAFSHPRGCKPTAFIKPLLATQPMCRQGGVRIPVCKPLGWGLQ